jgi:hypothetical protein
MRSSASSYNFPDPTFRCAFRGGWPPDGRERRMGFRVGRSLTLETDRGAGRLD